jgi:aldose 1-epimerase
MPASDRNMWNPTVEEFTLRSPGGAIARVMTWGAVVRDLQIPLREGTMQRVVLGFEAFDDYPRHSPYFGAVCGRVANRIAGAQFDLDGRRITLASNEGRHSLHGGPEAMSHRPWTVLDHGSDRLLLGIFDPDGTNGFPGNLTVTCHYQLAGEADLICDLDAFCDAPTPVNLAQHNYYNLDGAADIGACRMQVFADFHTPNDAELIPTGEIRSVDGSPYDFRTFKPIAAMQDGQRALLDGNFVLRSGGGELAHAATVISDRNGLMLEVHTDQPGLQLYDAHKLVCPVPGLGGQTLAPFSGFCLEPQKFPDGVHRPHFPQTMLKPGETYRQRNIFRFRNG